MPVWDKSGQGGNIFNEEQEQWLGDIIDQELQKEFNVIEDPDGYLQKLGERLLAQLPPTKIRYHFVIIDSPDLNSFGVVGGRIYIHRRMIAFTQNEDELAALLGHEIGHMIAHQVAVNVSEWFRELGITGVGDRQDVLKKWNQFRSNERKIRSRAAEKREKEDQFIADRIGLYAMARAGYAPSRAVEFADRSFQTKGKTGSFWSDLFGTTRTESKRLREIIRTAAPLGKECVPASAPDTSHFAQWQQSIIASKRMARKENLPGLLNKIALQPPLRGDLDRLLFSPDGKYLLAQDESSVFIVAREPLANLFRIDALDASMAQFSPDSRSVVFYDKELRVEKWEIESKQRTALHALTVQGCFQSRLSNSGDLLACIDEEFSLQIVDVNTNKTIYTRKKFYEPNWADAWQLYFAAMFGTSASLFEIHFSPDDHYFLVGHRTAAIGYDLKTNSEMHLPAKVKQLMADTFTFVGPDEIAGIDGFGKARKLVRAKLPSGDRVDEFSLLLMGKLTSPSKGNYLMVTQSSANPVVIVDLKAKKPIETSKAVGFTIFDQMFAGEQNSGEVALFDHAEKKIVGKIQLPESPLANARAAAFSQDGKWLALSGPNRGSVWNLETGERVFFTKHFEGVTFDQGKMLSKFPKNGTDPSRVYEFDPATKTTKLLYDLAGQNDVWQQGELLIHSHRNKEKNDFWGEGSVIQVHDVKTNNKLWERTLEKGRPNFFVSGKALTLVLCAFDAIKAAAKDDASLSEKLNSMDARKDACLLQALDAHTGKTLGSVLVDTGKRSFWVRSAITMGDTVFAIDGKGRILIYSLKSGQQQGAISGRLMAVSQNGDKMLVEIEKGSLNLYDVATRTSLSHFDFSSRVTMATFTTNDSGMLVLTADQKVYKLALDANPSTTAATATSSHF